MNNTVHNRIFRIARREVFRIATRPLYLFCMIIAPLFCYLFFTTLMWNGLPTDMPAGVVDLDNTATTRSIIRNLDAFQQTKIIAHYPSFADARKAMQQGKIYAFYYIPKGTTEKALASRQPKVSFYTNYSYLVAGSLLYKDQRTMSELAGGAIGRATLYAKGATEDQAMGLRQTSELRLGRRLTASSILGWSSCSSAYNTWRCRLLLLTTSSSIKPNVPMPAPVR